MINAFVKYFRERHWIGDWSNCNCNSFLVTFLPFPSPPPMLSIIHQQTPFTIAYHPYLISHSQRHYFVSYRIVEQEEEMSEMKYKIKWRFSTFLNCSMPIHASGYMRALRLNRYKNCKWVGLQKNVKRVIEEDKKDQVCPSMHACVLRGGGWWWWGSFSCFLLLQSQTVQ